MNKFNLFIKKVKIAMNKILKRIKIFFNSTTFRNGSIWSFLLVGLLLYFLSYTDVICDSTYKEIALKIADVLVIGCVVGYLSNAAEFLNIFKNELSNVIYAKDFLSKRKDLKDIWDRVSNAMFKNKFPEIHHEILKTLKSYFPEDDISYYKNYEVHTEIKWVDKDHGIIKVYDEVKFQLVAESDKSFSYKFETRGYENSKFEEYEMQSFKVDNENVKDKMEIEDCSENGVLTHKHSVNLSGKKEYKINYTREKTYSIYKDNYISFKAKYLVKGVRTELRYPEDILAIFISRGTRSEFEECVKKDETRIEMEYKDIVFPKQGYIFALTIKPKTEKL